uniref:Uncharacterized protein n=1 Tax=Arundo donax TaxID=35708 RepID=A0A0A8Z586_ARUDO
MHGSVIPPWFFYQIYLLHTTYCDFVLFLFVLAFIFRFQVTVKHESSSQVREKKDQEGLMTNREEEQEHMEFSGKGLATDARLADLALPFPTLSSIATMVGMKLPYEIYER